MRIIKQHNIDNNLNISYLKLNDKYILKYEKNLMVQEFKIRMTDDPDQFEKIENLAKSETLLNQIQGIFGQMNTALHTFTHSNPGHLLKKYPTII